MFKSTSVLCSLLIGLYCLSSQAQVKEGYFDYFDLFQLQMVDNPQLSPDGNTIVYERHQFDVTKDRQFSNLWSISYDGTNNQPLTSGTARYGNVTWSPNQQKIAYTSNQSGKTQIYVRDLKSGNEGAITYLTETPSRLSWSPDGKYILFSKFVPSSSKASFAKLPQAPQGAEWEKPAVVIDKTLYRFDGAGYAKDGYTHLFIVPSEGGTPRQLTQGDFNYSNASWAPDSQSILYTADTTGKAEVDLNNEQIYELNIVSGTTTKITDERGPHRGPQLSPDGKWIAYTGFKDEFVGYQKANIYVMSRDGSNPHSISDKLPQSASAVKWSADSKALYFRYDEHGNSKIGRIDLNGNYKEIADNLGVATSGRPYGGGSYSVSKNGRFAFAVNSTSRPTNLAVGTVDNPRSIKQLTHLNKEFFKTKKIGAVEEFWVDSSVDDFKIQGWIMTPPEFDASKKYPLILEIHGGPYTNYGSRFSPELQLMASRGYVVLYVNPRGSTSYDEAFTGYINNNYPSEDYNDLMDAVDHVLSKGYIDSQNLFVTGGSGGGLLTAWIVGKTDRFRAAAAAKPVINWYSEVLTADLPSFMTRYWFNKKPWEDPQQYLDFSPISLVGNVKTPTLLMTGMNDYRTPISEIEQYYAALKLREVETVMVRIQGAGHGIVAKPSNLFRKVAYITGWFDQHQLK